MRWKIASIHEVYPHLLRKVQLWSQQKIMCVCVGIFRGNSKKLCWTNLNVSAFWLFVYLQMFSIDIQNQSGKIQLKNKKRDNPP